MRCTYQLWEVRKRVINDIFPNSMELVLVSRSFCVMCRIINVTNDFYTPWSPLLTYSQPRHPVGLTLLREWSWTFFTFGLADPLRSGPWVYQCPPCDDYRTTSLPLNRFDVSYRETDSGYPLRIRTGRPRRWHYSFSVPGVLSKCSNYCSGRLTTLTFPSLCLTSLECEGVLTKRHQLN